MSKPYSRSISQFAVLVAFLAVFAPWSAAADAEGIFAEAQRANNSGDYEKAVLLFTSLAEQGYLGAQLTLGLMYKNGQGVQQIDKEAFKWFRLAATQGDPTAQDILGLMYIKGEGVRQNDKEAVRYFRLAAEQGHPEAQVNLGVMYAEGRGVVQSDEEAFAWYALSAMNGNSVGLQNMEEAQKRLSVAQFGRDQENAKQILALINKK